MEAVEAAYYEIVTADEAELIGLERAYYRLLHGRRFCAVAPAALGK